jgi:hypothetical protein
LILCKNIAKKNRTTAPKCVAKNTWRVVSE